MTVLVVPIISFRSSLDEASFFNWLNAIEGVAKISGRGADLHIKLRSKRLPDRSLRELIAIHCRYGLPMKSLGIYETEKNRDWFRDPGAYWFRSIFG